GSAGAQVATVAAAALSSEDVGSQPAGVVVDVHPLRPEGHHTAGCCGSVAPDVGGPAILVRDPAVHLHDQAVVVVDEVPADGELTEAVWHGDAQRRQPVCSHHAGEEVHLQHALGSLGHDAQGQLEGAAVPVRAAAVELGDQLADPDCTLLHGTGGDGDRILTGGRGQIAEVDHRECRCGDREPAAVGGDQPASAAHPGCGTALPPRRDQDVDLDQLRWARHQPEQERCGLQ